jgi:hypothetical protein
MVTLDEARSLLEAGDFAGAAQAMGELLERHPENIDLMSGFYAASYWEHRQALLVEPPAGRQAGSYLLEEWNAFENLLRKKKLDLTPSVDAAMKAVLNQAARQFRHRFKEGSVGSEDLPALLLLARNMMRLSSYRNAADLLGFALELQPHRPETMMLLGECRAIIGTEERDSLQYEKGLGMMRDAFLLHPTPLELQAYRSSPASEIIAELNFRFSTDEKNRAALWLPAEWMAAVLHYPHMRRLQSDEILQIEEESLRLERDLPALDDRYREKAAARLCFYSLVLLHSLYHHYEDDKRRDELITLIGSLRPGLLHRNR